jgi:hypothetical protein
MPDTNIFFCGGHVNSSAGKVPTGTIVKPKQIPHNTNVIYRFEEADYGEYT